MERPFFFGNAPSEASLAATRPTVILTNMMKPYTVPSIVFCIPHRLRGGGGRLSLQQGTVLAHDALPVRLMRIGYFTFVI